METENKAPEGKPKLELPPDMPKALQDLLQELAKHGNVEVVKAAEMRVEVDKEKYRNKLREAAGMRRMSGPERLFRWFIGDYWRVSLLAFHDESVNKPSDMEECYAVVNGFRKLAIGGPRVTSKDMASAIAYGMNRFIKRTT